MNKNQKDKPEDLAFVLNSLEEKHTFLLVLCTGLLEALKRKSISVHDSEIILFNPYAVDVLKASKVDRAIIRIVENGCELEDVESLAPEKMENNIDKLLATCEQLLNSSKKFDYHTVRKPIALVEK